MDSQLQLLSIQDQEAVKNTYYRYPIVTPKITSFKDHIEVKTLEKEVELYVIDEVILYIIAKFRFAPAWLIQQWFEVEKLNGYDIMKDWIEVGLVWADTTSMGVYLRPTYFLFEIMDIKETNYKDIPFNQINHNCAEEQIVFDVMYGNIRSEIWYLLKELTSLPAYHPLNIEGESGIPILIEDEFKGQISNNDELLKSIKEAKANNNPLTAEFNDLKLFTLCTDNDGEVYNQRPDLCIPMIRENGNPRSWAIELELTPKTSYDKIMRSYKDNLVYGNLLYLCGNSKIVERVKKGYKSVGGLGSCRLFVAPWVAPAQRITNYSAKEEEAYKTLLNTTKESTKDNNETSGRRRGN